MHFPSNGLDGVGELTWNPLKPVGIKPSLVSSQETYLNEEFLDEVFGTLVDVHTHLNEFEPHCHVRLLQN
jgi:hypothetical protein